MEKEQNDNTSRRGGKCKEVAIRDDTAAVGQACTNIDIHRCSRDDNATKRSSRGGIEGIEEALTVVEQVRLVEGDHTDLLVRLVDHGRLCWSHGCDFLCWLSFL